MVRQGAGILRADVVGIRMAWAQNVLLASRGEWTVVEIVTG